MARSPPSPSPPAIWLHLKVDVVVDVVLLVEVDVAVDLLVVVVDTVLVVVDVVVAVDREVAVDGVVDVLVEVLMLVVVLVAGASSGRVPSHLGLLSPWATPSVASSKDTSARDSDFVLRIAQKPDFAGMYHFEHTSAEHDGALLKRH